MACGAFYTATETVARPGHRAFEKEAVRGDVAELAAVLEDVEQAQRQGQYKRFASYAPLTPSAMCCGEFNDTATH